MTDVRFHCAICGTALTAAADASGAVEECHACGRQVPVPALIHLRGGSAGCASLFPEEILSVELRFRCNRCTTKLRIDVRWEGREVPCPKCNLQLKVPRWSHLREEPREEPRKKQRKSSRKKPRREAPGEPAASSIVRLSPAEIEFLSGAPAKPAAAQPAVA
jgi:hypothetical protein